MTMIDQIPDMPTLRAEIDICDKKLMALLVHRVRLIDRAIALKPVVAMPARAVDRVEQVAQNARDNATAVGFDPDFAELLWRQIIEWSIAREEKVLGTGVPAKP